MQSKAMSHMQQVLLLQFQNIGEWEKREVFQVLYSAFPFVFSKVAETLPEDFCILNVWGGPLACFDCPDSNNFE